jgi:GTP cyclohydrolase IA
VPKIETINWERCQWLANAVRSKIFKHPLFSKEKTNRIWGVPRGGIYAAMMVVGTDDRLDSCLRLVESPEVADFIIDDVVDTGKTRDKFPDTPFFALIDKRNMEKDLRDTWVVFPWERMLNEGDGPEENIRRLLEYIGEDPDREGLKETPERVIRSYATLFSGYKQKPEDVMKIFEDGACDEIVLLKNVEFTSMCEHHILPFSGKAHIAYIPDGRVIGVSKLARIFEIYARRLQIQERLCQQVTECLMSYLKPKGAACMIEASHLCMSCRGVQKQNAIMVTSDLKGVFLTDARTRSEFMSMVRG